MGKVSLLLSGVMGTVFLSGKLSVDNPFCPAVCLLGRFRVGKRFCVAVFLRCF